MIKKEIQSKLINKHKPVYHKTIDILIETI